MIELLLGAASQLPEHVCVAAPDHDRSYRGIADDALVVAGNLRTRGIERFGILEPDAAKVLTLLAGAAHAGAEPCVYPPGSDADTADRLADAFDHELVVTGQELDTPTVAPDDLWAPARASSGPDRSGGARLMVMTTGTSGHPRGVRHEWSRLLRTTRKIKPTPEQKWLLAYGLNQFGGLQILIHVLAARATLVAPASLRPRSALDAMRKGGVTHASGTPTFWRFVLSEMRADGLGPPPLAQVTLGGEAVPGPLLDRIRTAFPDANISQIYGATEFGQNITVRDGKPGLPLRMLETDTGRDVEFRVVDGELWVRSRASMLGYYNEAPVDARDWRATGDMVEVVGDRVEFRGRKSDVVNVGGVKVHPLPVEDLISAVPGVGLVRAFGRPNPLTGSIIAVEVVPEPGSDHEVLTKAIRTACAELPPAARPRSIKLVETMDTTGNKMTRSSGG